MPEVASKKVVRFGLFEANLTEGRLTKGGVRIKLQDQPFKILTILLEHPGEVIGRDELRHRLWPENTYVEFDDGLNTAIRKLRAALSDSADNPRFIETVPRRGYRFIAPVEDLTVPVLSLPVAQVVAAAEPQPPPPSSIAKSYTRFVPAIAALALIALALALLARYPHRVSERILHRAVPDDISSTMKARRSVAVLGFKNLSGRPDEAWVSTALSEMLAAELASGQQLRVIPGENVARMKLDVALPTADSYAADTLVKIRHHLGTDMVVVGSYLALGHEADGNIRIYLELQDTHSGDTIAVVSREGNESDLGDLISQSGASLRQKLGVGTVSADDAGHVLAALPTTPAAARFYAEGLVKLHAFDALGARDLFEKAIAADPNHALSHSALAESWSALGYDSEAEAEAKKALELSANLSREERLSIEGRYKEFSQDLPGAIKIYRTLRDSFPDDLEYALRLATAQITATQGSDALQTIARMRKLPPPLNQDARIDLAESAAADALSDFPRSQSAAVAAAEHARAQGSVLLVAAAKMREAMASSYLGDLDRAFANYIEARKLWIEGGNRRSAAAALHGIAVIQCDQGKFVDSRKSFELALAELRKLGAMRELASCAHNFGVLFSYQGDLQHARQYFEEALRIQRATRDARGVASDLDDLGNVLMSMGDLDAAMRVKEEARQGFHLLGNKFGESVTLFNMGEVRLAQGQLLAAQENYAEAMAISKETKDKQTRGYCLLGLAKVLAAQDHLAQARADAEKSVAIREKIKSQATISESRTELAEIALEQDNSTEAESLARAATQVFEKQKAIADASEAYAALARALLAEGKLLQAQTAAERGLSLARQSGDVIAGFESNFAAQTVYARSGRLQQSTRALESLRSQAMRQGFAGYELQARLYLGELELRSGSDVLARTHLRQLQSDARSKGFLLIARRAGTLERVGHPTAQ